MLSSFTEVIILHTKILGPFFGLDTALQCTFIEQNRWKKTRWQGDLKRMRMEISKILGVLYNQGRYMSKGVCLQGYNGGQGVACSCCGPLTCWRKDEVALCLFLCTLTNPLCQFNIIHTVSFLSSVQFCGKGSTRADYLQFVLRSAPNVSYPH